MATPALSKPALESWDTNAAFWDELMGLDGNKYWKVLEEPCLERLLGDRLAQVKCEALELTTGNGLCARWLAGHGARVLATDGSMEMLNRAKTYGTVGDHITYERLDVTQPPDFEPFVDKATTIGGFDVILMNMSIMDVATLEPLAASLSKLLKKDGVFVAQMLHPVFFTATHSRKIEVSFNPNTAEEEVERSKVIKEYLHVSPYKGVAAVGQPVAQHYFHRPLHELFSIFFKNGLVMDALEEPAFTEADFEPSRLESSCNFTQIPALMAFRLRRSI